MKKNTISLLIGMGLVLIGVFMKLFHFDSIYAPILVLGVGVELFFAIKIIKSLIRIK